MNIRTAVSAAAVVSLFAAGIVSAQASPNTSLSVTSSPVTTAVSPGTGVALGSVTLSGQAGSFNVASLPFNLTATNGGVPGNLSNCQVVNASNGQVLNTGSNAWISVAGGQNMVNFNTPLTIQGGSPVTLNIRCDVASGTASSSVFNFTAGAPTYAPGLMAQTAVVPSVAVGANQAILGIITLDASRSGVPVRVSSIPVSLSFNGVAASNLSNCSVVNLANGSILNTGGNAVNPGVTGSTFTFDTPLMVNAGSSATLLVRCNVSAAAPVGGTITMTVSPSSVLAQNANTGATLTPVQGLNALGNVGNSTGTITIGAPGTVTPGVPNTGAGGFALTALAILALSGIAAIVATRRYVEFGDSQPEPR